MSKLKFIFAGGGTGGHLFPAIAIAEEIKSLEPDSEIMFIGNKDKIEGKVVPQYGYKFKSIRISGVSRKMNLSNLLFPVKLLISVFKSIGFVAKFNPDVVIGTGGYVSGPVLWSASFLGYKTLLQDHNSYPGVTTRMLASKAKEVHLAFEEAKKYFKKQDNLYLTGFPVRSSFVKLDKEESITAFGFSSGKKTLFITGGSQGAKAINDNMLKIIPDLNLDNFQIIWQAGSFQYEEIKKACEKYSNIKVFEFIKEMNRAYSACDLAVTRAGATTIGELLNLEVPAILIPLPTAAEDHQTKNAKALCDKGAGLLIPENELSSKLKNVIVDLMSNGTQIEVLKNNLKKLQIKDSALRIAQSIINLTKNNDRV